MDSQALISFIETIREHNAMTIKPGQLQRFAPDQTRHNNAKRDRARLPGTPLTTPSMRVRTRRFTSMVQAISNTLLN